MRERDRDVREARLQKIAHAQARDPHSRRKRAGRRRSRSSRPDTPPAAPRSAAPEIRGCGIQRRDDAAVEIEPLDHAETVPALDEWLRFAPFQRKVVLAVHPLQIGDVLEPGRRHVDDVRAIAGAEGRWSRRSCRYSGRRSRRRARRGSPSIARTTASTGRRGVDGRFCDDEVVRRIVDADQVGKRSAGVDPDRSTCYPSGVPGIMHTGCLSRQRLYAADSIPYRVIGRHGKFVMQTDESETDRGEQD